MRRTASEVLRDLEIRVARLEKSASPLVLGDAIVAENNYTGSISFFVVDKVSPKSVVLQQVGSQYVSGDYNSGGKAVPDLMNEIGRPFRSRVKTDSTGNVSVTLKGYTTTVWDYKPVQTYGAY
jgi:hypothetical protein